MTRNATGLTLPELVIAMAVTSVIGLAVAGVAKTIATGNASAEDYNNTVVGARIAVDRVGRAVRSSALVTSSDYLRIALWTGDANGNGWINYNELAVISYDPGDRKLFLYEVVFDEPWQEESYNYVFWLYELSDAATVEYWLQSTSFCRTTVLATDVTGFDVSLSPSAPMTKLVRLALTLGEGDSAMAAGSAVGLRADWTSHVWEVCGQYYLDTE